MNKEHFPRETEFLLPATGKQKYAIARMCRALGIREEIEQRSMTRREARIVVWELRNRLRLKTTS